MNKLFYLTILFALVACQSGPKSQQQDTSAKAQIVETTIDVGGMHCDMCVKSIEKGVKELDGITSVKASLNDSIAVVKFDSSKTNLTEIQKAIEKRGYSVKKTM